HGNILQSLRMRRWLRCWLERPVHISPEQGPKLSPLRVSASGHSWCLYSCHPISEEESVAGEEALGQYPILQENIEGPGLRHGTERNPHHSSHGRRKRESPQTRGRNVQAWNIRSSNSLSDGRQRQSENPDDRDKRPRQEGSRPSSRRVWESRQETLSNLILPSLSGHY